MIFNNKIEISDNKFKRILFLLLGFICIGLGIIGIFLPVMPTTVFFLLASACFAKSSEKFHSWLLSNPVFGKYIKDYLENKTIPLRVKVVSLVFLWATILSSAYFFVENNYVKILLIIIALSVTFHIVSIAKPKMEKN